MYANPRKIKKHEYKFRADDDLHEILISMQAEGGEQMGVLVRKLVKTSPLFQKYARLLNRTAA